MCKSLVTVKFPDLKCTDNFAEDWPTKVKSVLSGVYAESNHVIPCTTAVISPPASHIKHTWLDHSLAVTDVYCGIGDLRCRVATTSLDQTCKLYELQSGQLLCSFLFNVGLTKVVMDFAEYWLFVGGTDGSIYRINLFVQHLSQRRQLTEECSDVPMLYKSHRTSITGLIVSKWSHNLISSSEEDSIIIWDIASQQVLQTLKLKGPVCDIVLAGCDLSFFFQEQTNDSAFTSKFVQPFHKHLYFTSQMKDGEKQKVQTSAIPVMATRGHSASDALHILSLNSLYSLSDTTFASHKDVHDSSVTIQGLKQEISEVKDVHKRLYEFLMDAVVDNK